MSARAHGAAGITVKLFGAFEMRIDDQPPARLRTRKGQWLVALLLFRHGSPVERDWLAGTLWPDCDDEKALYSLRRSLTDLRRALGPYSEALRAPTPRTLCLSLQDDAVDLAAFDSAAARGDIASLEQAVRLY